MAFWRTLTIRQMANMMKNRAQPWLAKGWRELIDPIRAEHNNPDGTFDNTARRLSGCSRVPAVHFFVWIALIHSHPDTAPDFHQLAQEYLPDVADERMDTQRLFNRLYGGGFADTAAALTSLTNKLNRQDTLQENSTLSQLITVLNNHNVMVHGEGANIPLAEWNFHGGLVTLQEHLNNWDTTCQKMWENSQNPAIPEICGLIQGGVRQLILTGAPGTGKTYTAGLAAQMMGAVLPRYEGEERPYPLVQFHPSYDYTDFVEGLRPVAAEDGSHFLRLDGSFKAFCRQVADKGEADKLYFFLIDEINRADLSKVFGELMFCLENDKRGEGHKVQTQYWNLPTYLIDAATLKPSPCEEDVFANGFYIPENVVILGTMNDIDRSVESMDFALRRRFTWREVRVTHALLEQAFASGNFVQVLEDNAQETAQRVMALNQVIAPDQEGKSARFGLNRQYYISQGQFTGLPGTFQELDELLRFVWDFRLESLLGEYVRGEDDQEVKRFLKDCRAAFLGEESRA